MKHLHDKIFPIAKVFERLEDIKSDHRMADLTVVESEAMRGLGSFPTVGNILSLDFFT